MPSTVVLHVPGSSLNFKAICCSFRSFSCTCWKHNVEMSFYCECGATVKQYQYTGLNTGPYNNRGSTERSCCLEQLLYMYSVSAVCFGAVKHITAGWGHDVQCVPSVHMIDFMYVIYVVLKHISVSVQPKEKQTALIQTTVTPPRVKWSICGQNSLIYSAVLSSPICASAVHAL